MLGVFYVSAVPALEAPRPKPQVAVKLRAPHSPYRHNMWGILLPRWLQGLPTGLPGSVGAGPVKPLLSWVGVVQSCDCHWLT